MRDFLSKILPKQGAATRACCFHFGRCGSTLLGNMLAAHPQMEWKGEVFHAFHERADRSTAVKPFQTLEQLIAHSKHPHFGFETKFQHLDSNGLNLSLESYLSELKKLGFGKLIILRRQNLLRQAISVARGQATQKWHVSSKKQKPEMGLVELDIANVSLGGKNRHLLDCFKFLEQTYLDASRLFARLEWDCLQICYEKDLQQNPFDGYQLAVDYLGVPLVRPEISLQKLESRPIKKIVSNYSQLRDCLSGTEYEWMCEQ